MRIFLTGATGFIGSHLLRRLVAQGHQVHCLVRPGSSLERIRDLRDAFITVEGDLSDSGRLRSILKALKPEAAIHLAWYAVPGRYWEAPENLDCVKFSLGLAERLVETGCRRLVVAGSCAEYDWRYGYLSEDRTPCGPQTLYGASKHGLRLMLEKYGLNTGLEVAWPRFFFLYGPSESPQRLASSVIRSLLDGKPALCSNGQQMRDFLYIEDAAAAVCAILESSLKGPINVASGVPVSVRNFVDRIASQIGSPGQVRYGAIPTDPAEPSLLVGDNQRLTTQTPWVPKVTLEEGIRRTIEWWKLKK